jgi:hypothetical protein
MYSTFGSLDLPKIKSAAGFDPSSKSPTPTAPKRITDISHISGMVAGHQRRMSGKYSRLGPPKRPYVSKGKVS